MKMKQSNKMKCFRVYVLILNTWALLWNSIQFIESTETLRIGSWFIAIKKPAKHHSPLTQKPSTYG